MRTPSSSALEAASPRRSLFVLPALTPPRREGLTLLVLADGNARSSTRGGYAGGARRVVSIAEHLARRPDVAAMVACVLSPDNIAKRGERFFSALYEAFVELGVAVASRGTLVSSGVRMEVGGDLGPLRARGGRALALADAIEAVVEMTARVRAPALRLVLGVGYGPDTVRALDVDVVLRTGMEEPGVLRLSGLSTHEGVASCAITTLWPEVEPREVDGVIDLYKQRASPRLADGHGAPAVVDLAIALDGQELDAPVRVTLPTDAAPAVVAAALERLYAGPLLGSRRVAVEHVGDGRAAPVRYGPERGERHQIRVVAGGPPAAWAPDPGALASVLAPGQTPPLFTIPRWLPLGHANVHACAATAQGMVEGIRAALRFAAAHPPLFGSDRANGSTARPRALEVVEAPPSAAERDELGDHFADKTLAWAASAGLLLPGAAWRRAAANYALTAFFIHFRVPTEWDPAGAHWEDRADLCARYMLLVAAGDEGVFDRVLEGEAPDRRWARLERSSRFLQGVLGFDGARVPVPDVPGAELLAAISGQWEELFERYRRACHPAAAASFRVGLSSLYAASLAEHHAGIGLLEEEERAGKAAIEGRFAAAPPPIAARARALVDGALQGDPSATDELRVLSYLAEAGSAIGAGLLFRAAALAAPAPCVTGRRIALLDATTTLLDYHVRLSNDLSGLLGSPGGDRDPKQNACTILIPASASGPPREAAIVAALATCRTLAGWLGGEIRAQIDRVAESWPSMGSILQRGTFVGRRVYEVGHYTTVSRGEMSRIFDEAERG